MMKSCLPWLNVVADLFRFLVLSLRSQSSLAAENLFLRKQLGFYEERSIRPRRTSPPAQVFRLEVWRRDDTERFRGLFGEGCARECRLSPGIWATRYFPKKG